MRVLLHELCICSDEGATVVGQAEHEEQSVKHGGNKDMLVLAKKVSRVLLLMGLESHGAYGMVMDDAVSPDQRALQQETQGDESSYSMWLGIAGIFASGAATNGFRASGETMTIWVFSWQSLMPTLEGFEQILTVYKELQLSCDQI